jgi:hypothetical protein
VTCDVAQRQLLPWWFCACGRTDGARLIWLHGAFELLTQQNPRATSRCQNPDAPACSGCAQGAFELLTQQNPRATSRMLEGMARRIAAASSARGRRCTQASLVWPVLTRACNVLLMVEAGIAAASSARGRRCACAKMWACRDPCLQPTCRGGAGICGKVALHV